MEINSSKRKIMKKTSNKILLITLIAAILFSIGIMIAFRVMVS